MEGGNGRGWGRGRGRRSRPTSLQELFIAPVLAERVLADASLSSFLDAPLADAPLTPVVVGLHSPAAGEEPTPPPSRAASARRRPPARSA